MEYFTFNQVQFMNGEFARSYEVMIPRSIVIRYSNSLGMEVADLLNNYNTKNVSDLEDMFEKEVLENL